VRGPREVDSQRAGIPILVRLVGRGVFEQIINDDMAVAELFIYPDIQKRRTIF
jgi:hypothetical protein